MDTASESRIVGNAFVQQYFVQMHKDSSQLHRFYLEQSSFVHGGAELGSDKAVLGQKVSEQAWGSRDTEAINCATYSGQLRTYKAASLCTVATL